MEKRLCICFFSAFVLSAIVFISFFGFFYIKAPYVILTQSSPWLRNMYIVKEMINERETSKQRLIIISGSNSLYGFDSEIIDKNTAFTPINLAITQGIPMHYHVDWLIRCAKENDIIFMPLEFSYYFRDKADREIEYIQNMLVWDKNHYQSISTKEKLRALLRQNLAKIPRNIIKYFRQKPIDFHLSKDEVMANIQAIWAKKEKIFIKYSYLSLNQYGDFFNQEKNEVKIKEEYFKDKEISEYFISEYKRLEKFAKSKHIKIFLTYPTTAENPLFSVKSKESINKIESLKSNLAKNGIKIYGDFRDFHFDEKYFFDTVGYHLNTEGAKLRTEAFVRLLNELKESGEL